MILGDLLGQIPLQLRHDSTSSLALVSSESTATSLDRICAAPDADASPPSTSA
jgi:hypothetical protein